MTAFDPCILKALTDIRATAPHLSQPTRMASRVQTCPNLWSMVTEVSCADDVMSCGLIEDIPGNLLLKVDAGGDASIGEAQSAVSNNNFATVSLAQANRR